MLILKKNQSKIGGLDVNLDLPEQLNMVLCSRNEVLIVPIPLYFARSIFLIAFLCGKQSFLRSSPIKWFKHDADANHDAKLEKVLMKYGADGYALYWLCLELIALPIDKTNITFELEHDAEILGHRLKLDSKRVEEIMHYFINLNLFELNSVTKKITCLKLAERIENSIIKSPCLKEIQHDLKGKNPGLSEIIKDNSGKVRPDIDIDKELFILPGKVSKNAWQDFEDHRKAIKKPLSDKARTIAANLLSEYPESVQIEIVNNTIVNRWVGLFRPKGGKNEKNGRADKTRELEEWGKNYESQRPKPN